MGLLQVYSRTEAGRQLEELRDGPHRNESAQRWQEVLQRKRAEERCRANERAPWKSLMQTEWRELEQRKDGQLVRLLGEALQGEAPATFQRPASADRRQEVEDLEALMSYREEFYKHVEELCQEDMLARVRNQRG